MKKRSMLAIASLAAGFVVAAVTPSHALSGEEPPAPHAGDALSSLDHTIVADDGLVTDDGSADQHG
ncbi:hypothetical protein ACFOOM_12605 [Streptomyces echinoruber]|nr:hypothetical protein [Streptomyces echinoruber]